MDLLLESQPKHLLNGRGEDLKFKERGSSVGKPSLANPEVGSSSPSFRSLIARGGGRKPVSLISPTAQRVAVIGHNRAIIPPLIRHTSQPASSRLNMVCIKKIIKKK